MLAAKLRQATSKDTQELYEFALVSIRSVHTSDYEQEILLEEFSMENTVKWFESENTKVLVATYMGFIIGCCVLEENYLTHLLVSEDYQRQGVASSLWEFARSHALAIGITSAFRGEILHRYAEEIINDFSVSEKNSYELYSVLEQQPATIEEINDAKESLRKWRKKSKYYFYTYILNLFLLWFFFSGAIFYVFSPNRALEGVVLDARKEFMYRKKVSSNPKESFSKWKIDYLMWRGAEPIYTDDIGECGGAMPIVIMWFQPELLKYLTKHMSRGERLSISEKCADLINSEDKIKRVKEVLRI